MTKVYGSAFSYKYGDPVPHATLVIDCRGIQNPHHYGGNDKAKRRRVMENPIAWVLLNKAQAHLAYNPDGHVAFGCTYGRHRSVALANALNRTMRKESNA